MKSSQAIDTHFPPSSHPSPQRGEGGVRRKLNKYILLKALCPAAKAPKGEKEKKPNIFYNKNQLKKL